MNVNKPSGQHLFLDGPPPQAPFSFKLGEKILELDEIGDKAAVRKEPGEADAVGQKKGPHGQVRRSFVIFAFHQTHSLACEWKR